MANPKKIKATPKQTSILFLISLCPSLIIRLVFTYIQDFHSYQIVNFRKFYDSFWDICLICRENQCFLSINRHF